MSQPCSICGKGTIEVPIFNNLPVSSAHLSAIPKYFTDGFSFVAGCCSSCDHIQNNAWLQLKNTPTIYGHDDYQLKTAVSSSMSQNLRNIASWIVEKSNKEISNLRVLEIASGSGELARWFADQNAQVYTVDPSVKDYNYKNITHSKELFTTSYPFGEFDCIIARHIIEHISDPAAFLHACKEKLGKNGMLYLEMPNGRIAIDQKRPIEYFIDHIQHFSSNSIQKLIRSCDLTVSAFRYLLSENHMAVCATKEENKCIDAKNEEVNCLKEELIIAMKSFQEIIDKVEGVNSFIVYGAGAHASTFVNVLSKGARERIVAVVDKDKAKHGKFLLNTSVPITMPLETMQADLIVNTAVLYPKEVEDYLVNTLRVGIPVLHATGL
jgi:2-polyprenyl-3-methyl-5-hydroxy-6-metoxy-1,4-benzoquinol methylase